MAWGRTRRPCRGSLWPFPRQTDRGDRIRTLPDGRFHGLGDTMVPPALEELVSSRTDQGVIITCWPEALPLSAAIRTGAILPSTLSSLSMGRYIAASRRERTRARVDLPAPARALTTIDIHNSPQALAPERPFAVRSDRAPTEPCASLPCASFHPVRCQSILKSPRFSPIYG